MKEAFIFEGMMRLSIFGNLLLQQQRQQDLKCVAQPSTLATHCWGGPRMGGRQSVQTDVHVCFSLFDCRAMMALS